VQSVGQTAGASSSNAAAWGSPWCRGVDAEFVVAAAQVLHERVASHEAPDIHARASICDLLQVGDTEVPSERRVHELAGVDVAGGDPLAQGIEGKVDEDDIASAD
jgi:hypothetical protein